MADTKTLFISTLLLLAFAVLRLSRTSSITWLADAMKPYGALEIAFLFGGAFLSLYGWTSRWRLSLFISIIVIIAFFVVAGGA